MDYEALKTQVESESIKVSSEISAIRGQIDEIPDYVKQEHARIAEEREAEKAYTEFEETMLKRLAEQLEKTKQEKANLEQYLSELKEIKIDPPVKVDEILEEGTVEDII